MRIERVEVRAVAPPVPRYTWSDDLPEQFMTNTLVRVCTNEGVEGVAGVSNYTSHDFDRYTAETLRHLVPIVLGKDPLQRETLWHALRPRAFPITPCALAVLDAALWDLAGKAAHRPLRHLLGGARDRLPAYASTPLLADVPAYLQFVEQLIEQGFRAIKFHAWCVPEKDLELARAVRKKFPGDEIAFMHDAETNYNRAEALRVARELEQLGFTWLEAPLPDWDIDGYRELTSRVSIPILPAGNWFQDLASFGSAIRSGAWRVARTDITACGGLTPARKAMILAQAAGIPCEVMCWGCTLISTANLQLMLAFDNSRYYEQPVPYEAYEYGMHTVVRTKKDGFVYGPNGPGIGVEIDWPAMERATIHRLDFTAGK